MKRDLEARLSDMAVAAGLPKPMREMPVCSSRRWRWDLVWPGDWGVVAVEVMGGTWNNGGHVRGRQYQSDCDKANAGTALGVKVLRVTAEDVASGRAVAWLLALIGPREGRNEALAQVLAKRTTGRHRGKIIRTLANGAVTKLPDRVKRAAGL